MTSLAAIVLADGQATPVNHTFSPVGIDAVGVAKLVDRSGGISIGFPALTISVRSPSKGSKNYRVIGKVVVPTLEVTSPSTGSGIQPAPTKAYDLLGTIEFVLPERSTLLERQNVFAYMKNLMANANLSSAVTTFETIY
jgi:hypothetical protein